MPGAGRSEGKVLYKLLNEANGGSQVKKRYCKFIRLCDFFFEIYINYIKLSVIINFRVSLSVLLSNRVDSGRWTNEMGTGVESERKGTDEEREQVHALSLSRRNLTFSPHTPMCSPLSMCTCPFLN